VPKTLEIAIVDDDESFRMALVESLSSLGYLSEGYASANDYIDTIKSRLFDCVVTDHHMPGMSGLKMTQHLAQQGSKIPVILITAQADPNLEAEASAAGALCLLRKPFQISDLIDCIEGAVKEN